MNILVVEDEKQVALSIKKTLLKSNKINIVDISNDFDSAFEKIHSKVFDIVLLDIFLGRKSLTGLDLCKKIREKNSEIPVIIITGFRSIKYLEEAFKLGASDYIRKPFDSKELGLRVERWLQMSSRVSHTKNINYKGLDYNQERNEFYYNDKHIPLTKKNKLLLRLFIEQPEKLLKKQYIKEKFWGDFSNIDKNRNLRSNIQGLRKSLEPECSKWIRTIRGEGYILKK